jgi:GNAT superfamily N-acetyltransferase
MKEAEHPQLDSDGENDDPDHGVRIRPWRTGDGPVVDSLLDASADALWKNQFHGLHGPDSDEPLWRRCRLAIDRGGTVIGAATIVVNPLHAGRMPCAIEVAHPWRRRGIGSILLARMRAQRPDPSRPLSTKLRPDTAAAAFVAQAGGRVYQRCPGIVVDASHPSARQWAAAQPKVTCTDLTAVPTDTLVTAFADLYTWSHHNWSPVTDTNELVQVARQEIAQIDRPLSTGAWVDGQLAAVALAFPGDNGIEVVAETIHPRHPRGQQLVACALATLLQTLTARGGSYVYIDGHLTDPHLQSVLDRIPQADAKPVDLIEIGG